LQGYGDINKLHNIGFIDTTASRNLGTVTFIRTYFKGLTYWPLFVNWKGINNLLRQSVSSRLVIQKRIIEDTLGATTACAAAHIEDTNKPSTPKGVKNV
jgi:hypothetical protein